MTPLILALIERLQALGALCHAISLIHNQREVSAASFEAASVPWGGL